MKIKKLLYVILGCIGLALGAVGAVLPLLPAFPFLLLAAFCFAKSSEKLHRWFTGTKLYKKATAQPPAHFCPCIAAVICSRGFSKGPTGSSACSSGR